MTVLVADPPWQFKSNSPGVGTGGAVNHYPCMSLDEIKEFPDADCDDPSVLFLWRVSSMVEEAYEVVRAWGYKPKTELVWKKLTAKGNRHFGMGHYLRAEHETCIIATRGSNKIKNHSIRSVFEAPVGRHSEKPAEFYRIVESLVDGPYIELFSRKRRKGWTCKGVNYDRRRNQEGR